jgi:hypothetical protein
MTEKQFNSNQQSNDIYNSFYEILNERFEKESPIIKLHNGSPWFFTKKENNEFYYFTNGTIKVYCPVGLPEASDGILIGYQEKGDEGFDSCDVNINCDGWTLIEGIPETYEEFEDLVFNWIDRIIYDIEMEDKKVHELSDEHHDQILERWKGRDLFLDGFSKSTKLSKRSKKYQILKNATRIYVLSPETKSSFIDCCIDHEIINKEDSKEFSEWMGGYI